MKHTTAQTNETNTKVKHIDFWGVNPRNGAFIFAPRIDEADLPVYISVEENTRVGISASYAGHGTCPFRAAAVVAVLEYILKDARDWTGVLDKDDSPFEHIQRDYSGGIPEFLKDVGLSLKP